MSFQNCYIILPFALRIGDFFFALICQDTSSNYLFVNFICSIASLGKSCALLSSFNLVITRLIFLIRLLFLFGLIALSSGQ